MFYPATPESAYVIVRNRALPDTNDATGQSGMVELVARRGGCPGGTAVEVSAPLQALSPAGRGRFLIPRTMITPSMIGRAYQPWHADVEPEARARWKAYLQPESITLRNLINADTPGTLEA